MGNARMGVVHEVQRVMTKALFTPGPPKFCLPFLFSYTLSFGTMWHIHFQTFGRFFATDFGAYDNDFEPIAASQNSLPISQGLTACLFSLPSLFPAIGICRPRHPGPAGRKTENASSL
jgi:hypothetical protein